MTHMNYDIIIIIYIYDIVSMKETVKNSNLLTTVSDSVILG